MAQPPETNPKTRIFRDPDLDREEVWQARVDLAACFRMAARLGLHEGICNHFSAMVPDSDALFLVNPLGWGFGEITASRLLVCDLHGRVIAGSGAPEATAFHIHARLHLRLPRARAAFHTHMPNATALAMLEGPPLAWAGQTALKFHGRVAIDDAYGGLALDAAEGDRIAAACGAADVIFLRQHGVIVLGRNIAAAWDDLYYLERACEVQRLAESTGRRLTPVPPGIAERTARQMRDGGEAAATLHLESIRRILDKEAADFGTDAAPGATRNPAPMRPTRIMPPALALLATLAGCKLIDQTTFAPAPVQPSEARIASLRPVQERPALLSIRYSTPDPAYGQALRTAVTAAEQRRPGTAYDVVALVPAAADPALLAQELGKARQDAAGVMQAMMALGVPDTRISLGARTDPALKVREVRVYVR